MSTEQAQKEIDLTAFSTVKTGSKYTNTFKTYVTENGEVISPFHDIQLKNSDGTYNCVNEIPRFENAKFEISKEDEFNPIKQDIKKGNVRFIKNVFPTKGYPGNYGAFPRTFEEPTVKDKHCDAKGDNDPLDCVDISNVTKHVGTVYKAKVLGCLAMLDDGEADWKVIVIDAADENAEKFNDLNDVKEHCPGFLENLYKWFKDCKKPENTFALGGKYQDAAFSKMIIEEAHEKYLLFEKRGGDGKISMKSKIKNDTFDKSVLKPETDAQQPDHINHLFYF